MDFGRFSCSFRGGLASVLIAASAASPFRPPAEPAHTPEPAPT